MYVHHIMVGLVHCYHTDVRAHISVSMSWNLFELAKGTVGHSVGVPHDFLWESFLRLRKVSSHS